MVKVVSGKVARPAAGQQRSSSTSRARDGIPLGSTVDTLAGVVELTSVPKAGGTPQAARFYEGVFKVTQVGSVTNLALDRAAGLVPRRRAQRRGDEEEASATCGATARARSARSGKYSSATVRGTKWLVQDSCAGTLTRVVRGSVTVRDKVKRKTVVVRAGKSYLAKPSAAESREQRAQALTARSWVVVAGEPEDAVAGGGQRGVLGAVVCGRRRGCRGSRSRRSRR